jgi:DNA-binding response OmpR family regulator
MTKPNILVYEQECIVAEDIRRKIHSMTSSQVHVTHSISTMFDAIETNLYDLLIIDVMFRFDSGADKFQELLDKHTDVPVIMLSSIPSPAGDELLPHHERMKVLSKPIDFFELRKMMCDFFTSTDMECCTESSPEPSAHTGRSSIYQLTKRSKNDQTDSNVREHSTAGKSKRSIHTNTPVDGSHSLDDMTGTQVVNWHE